ncbi:hypothetical protein GCM10010495_17340 [Kitasatospora herbaricolor]|nr:hypothetical protein GCM10010495_17340 [Kitasatospora herbaricolor]
MTRASCGTSQLSACTRLPGGISHSQPYTVASTRPTPQPYRTRAAPTASSGAATRWYPACRRAAGERSRRSGPRPSRALRGISTPRSTRIRLRCAALSGPSESSTSPSSGKSSFGTSTAAQSGTLSAAPAETKSVSCQGPADQGARPALAVSARRSGVGVGGMPDSLGRDDHGPP